MLSLCAAARAGEVRTIGWLEEVRVFPAKMLFLAKIDTGSYNSSINAQNIEHLERDGRRWLRFDIVNRAGRRKTVELPQVRETTIKLHLGEKEQRPLVEMGICLGTVYKETLVSLVNREGYFYPLLLGRNFIRGDFAVDPSIKKTTPPECEQGAADE